MAADRLTQRQIIKGCIGLVSDAALPSPTAMSCKNVYTNMYNLLLANYLFIIFAQDRLHANKKGIDKLWIY